MFILDKAVCTLEFGPGVRYMIYTSREETEGAYEVSVDALVSDISKYPWLTGITLIGAVNNQQKECIELLKKLPKHLDTRIEIFLPRRDFENSEIGKMVDLVVYGEERFKSEYMNNEEV